MSRNGSGTYSLPVNGWNPAVNGTPATAADWQALANDIAAALTQSVSRDGQTPITGNMPMSGYKFTGLGEGTGAGQSVRWEQLFSQGQPANLASAATTDIGGQTTSFLNITGTATITSFGTTYNGPRFLRFDSALTLTHNASTLILPAGVNITTAANDVAVVVPYGVPASGWIVASYSGAAGVSYTAKGTGAFPRSVKSRLSDVVSILDFIPESEHAAIRAGTSTYDCRASLANAIASVQTPGPGYTVAGPAIMFPPGDYNFAGFVDLKRQIRITGSSGGMPDGQPTKLIFPINSEGIIINTYNTINGGVESPPTLGADGTIIENITIQGGGGTNANAHGIWLRGRATIRNVTVRDFRGHNINVVATAGGGGALEGNANNFRLDTIRTIQSGRCGLFVDGADANAGTIIGVDATSNAEWGIWDSSFLGNTYVGCHTDNNTIGSYQSDDANARNCFIGCYSESGHPASEIKAPAQVIGGLHGAGFTAGTTAAIFYETGIYGASIGTSTVRKTGKFTQVDLSEKFGIGTENPGESAVFGTNRILDMKGPANDVAGYFIQRTLNNSVETRYFTEGGVSPRTVVMAVTAHRLELGTSNTPRLAIDSTPGHITPGADNTQNLGSASFRFATVYAGTGAINTSDARQKQQARTLSEKERAVAIKAKSLLKSFKFNDSVEVKGDKARIHFGIYAQELKAAFESEGLVAEDYSVLCYDKWNELPEIIKPVLDEDGNETGETHLAQSYRAAGNRYGVRYDELFAFILSAL